MAVIAGAGVASALRSMNDDVAVVMAVVTILLFAGAVATSWKDFFRNLGLFIAIALVAIMLGVFFEALRRV